MSIIGYHQAESLFSSYPVLLAMLESLRIDLNMASEFTAMEYDDEIYTSVVGGKVLSDTPRPPVGFTSDTTGNIAIRYGGEISQENKYIKKEIREEILLVSSVVEKIDISLRTLPGKQSDILKMYYWEDKSWKEIADCLSIVSRQAQLERADGIRRMVSILRLDETIYITIMNMIKGG